MKCGITHHTKQFQSWFKSFIPIWGLQLERVAVEGCERVIIHKIVLSKAPNIQQQLKFKYSYFQNWIMLTLLLPFKVPVWIPPVSCSILSNILMLFDIRFTFCSLLLSVFCTYSVYCRRIFAAQLNLWPA